LGFEITDSCANFIFARHPKISGENLYLELKKRGVLVRHFSSERISDFCRITVGSKLEMKTLIKEISLILEDLK
jgi:histidinol-phosphate aminotransferase